MRSTYLDELWYVVASPDPKTVGGPRAESRRMRAATVTAVPAPGEVSTPPTCSTHPRPWDKGGWRGSSACRRVGEGALADDSRRESGSASSFSASSRAGRARRGPLATPLERAVG